MSPREGWDVTTGGVGCHHGRGGMAPQEGWDVTTGGVGCKATQQHNTPHQCPSHNSSVGEWMNGNATPDSCSRAPAPLLAVVPSWRRENKLATLLREKTIK